MGEDVKSRVVAVCAPGRKTVSALYLTLMNEPYDELLESPILDGSTSIIVMQEPQWDALAQPVEIKPPPVGLRNEWLNHLVGASVIQPRALVILGGIS